MTDKEVGIYASFGKFVMYFVVVVGWCFFMAYPTKWAVNYLLSPELITAIFGVAHIGFWQSLILNYLTGALFRTSFQTSTK